MLTEHIERVHVRKKNQSEFRYFTFSFDFFHFEMVVRMCIGMYVHC